MVICSLCPTLPHNFKSYPNPSSLLFLQAILFYTHGSSSSLPGTQQDSLTSCSFLVSSMLCWSGISRTLSVQSQWFICLSLCRLSMSRGSPAYNLTFFRQAALTIGQLAPPTPQTISTRQSEPNGGSNYGLAL